MPPAEVGTFATIDELLTLLRARQIELGLTNEALERVCGFAAGQVNKYLGPTREKAPGAFSLGLLLDSLGLSGALYVDPAKAARLSGVWGREGARKKPTARVESSRLSKLLIKRATPEVRRQLAVAANKARWSRIPKAKRRKIARELAQRRWKMRPTMHE